MDNTFDVVIVGGGGSGLATGVSATENGASVLLLEKRPELGGSTGIAVGSFTANCTQIQKQAGIEDTLDAHVEDVGKFPHPDIEARNNEDLRRFFLSHAADTLDWLMEMGLNFHGPSPEPPNRVPRMHNVVPGAKAYIATLRSHLIKKGGKIMVNAPVVELVIRDGTVSGVVAMLEGRRRSFTAKKGVVLAAGDYTNSPDLISRFKGKQFAKVEGINPHSKGDGHLLAEGVGARMVNMDVTYGPEIRFVAPKGKTFQQLLPANGPLASLTGKLISFTPQALLNLVIRRLLVTWQHPEDSLLEDGAILLNQKGERFCEETQTPEREIAIAEQPGKCCYILLDQRLIERYSSWPHFISTAPKIAYAYVEDYLRLRPDIAVAASTLERVAAIRGLPSENVVAEVVRVNESRKSIETPALAGGRCVLLGPAKAYFTTTEGGAAINQKMQVLDQEGKPILGLYAVGQNGLGGQILWGHGLHIAWAMTSGRLVGELLAESAGF